MYKNLKIIPDGSSLIQMVNTVLPAAFRFVLPSPCGQMTLSVGFFLDLLYATGMI